MWETVSTVAAIPAAVLAAGFFTAGTVGLLRFPDLRSRLHALTKADTLGLGFTMLALSLRADSWWQVGKFALIWMLGMTVAAVAATLLATEPVDAAEPEDGATGDGATRGDGPRDDRPRDNEAPT